MLNSPEPISNGSRIIEYGGNKYQTQASIIQIKTGDLLVLKSGDLERIVSISPTMNWESFIVKTDTRTYSVSMNDSDFEYGARVE